MFGLKLLLFLFQAPCGGYELKLKALLLERILRHDEVFVAKTCLLLGGWRVTIVLQVIFYGLFVRFVLPAILFLFGCSPEHSCFCLIVEGVQAVVRPELPLYPDRGVAVRPPYPDHVVVGPHYARKICAPTPPHRIEVAVCVSGRSWLGG